MARETRRFLLMKHAHRFDLPKGHVEEGETEIECALRETWEETGIPREAITLDPDFRYAEVYFPFEPPKSGQRVEKTLVLFLGWIETELPITLTEHVGYEWRDWRPPHYIQKFTIDPLFRAIEAHLLK